MKAVDMFSRKGIKVKEEYVGHILYAIRGFSSGKGYLYHLNEYTELPDVDYYGTLGECMNELNSISIKYQESIIW